MIEPRPYSGALSAWHPVHVILAAYPIACFTGALATDITYAETADMMWSNFSIWLITIGIVMGVLAALVGIGDALVGPGRTIRRRRAWPHTLGMALVLLLSLINAFVHSRDAYDSVVPAGLWLSLIVAILVLVTSWAGARLQIAPVAERIA